METLLHDLRYALRMLIKNPGFSAVAVSALAFGIGANTAIFSVVNGVLLQPLPFKDPDRLVRVMRSFRQGTGNSISVPKYTVWKQQNQVFEYMAAYDFAGPGFNLSGGDVPEQIRGIHVSADFFPLFGAVPAIGRTFTPEEDRPGGARLVVVSPGLWKRRFGADPGLMGKSINLNGELYTVIGVMAENFRSYPPADVYIPLQADPNSTNQGHYLSVAARLKPGVTLEAARSQIKIAGETFRRAYPQWMGSEEGVAVIPFKEEIVGNVRPALLILTGAVGFVLLIACANVANLLLARASARNREVAVRMALGADRGRLVRQLLTESVLLSAVGGMLGLVLGSWGVRALLAISPENIPRARELTASGLASVLEWNVLGFTLLISLFTGMVFGLVPALQISKPDLNSALKENSARSTTGRHSLARNLLIVSEVSLALVLLIGATLLIRTFVSLRAVNPGFDAKNVLTLQTSLNGANYATTPRVETLTTQLIQRIEGLPGVEAATSSANIPLEFGPDLPFTIEGRPLADGARYHGDVQWRYGAPNYFKALRVPLLRGRFFDERDSGKATPVAIINDAMARRFWPNEDPMGKRITIGKGLGPEFEDPPRQIVGIVGNVREDGLNQPAPEVVYIPYGQIPDGMTQLGNKIVPASWIIRSSGDPRGFISAIQREFLAVDRQLPVSNIRTMEQVVGEVTARQNFNMLLLSTFAGVALLLAAIGIYGVMSYSVQQRTHEIGIRIALGAGHRDVLRLVVGQCMLIALAGVGIGLAASVALTRLLSGLLFGVRPTDPMTFAGVTLLLTAVALAASYIPARRAARVDPIIALRYE